MQASIYHEIRTQNKLYRLKFTSGVYNSNERYPHFLVMKQRTQASMCVCTTKFTISTQFVHSTWPVSAADEGYPRM